MTNLSNIQEAQIYVGTYSKYNEGSIFGKWLQLSDYTNKEDFLEACQELHKDEQDPEFMFQDWENIPDCFIHESYISEKFWELSDALLSIDKEDAFLTFLDWRGFDLSKQDIDDIVSSFEEAYMGEYDSMEDYAYEIAEEMDLPEFAVSYFDYEKYARDLSLDGYYHDNGYLFNSN